MLATTTRTSELDSVLFEVCETLQLTPTQHRKAVERYLSISQFLNSPESPFSFIESIVYSQGSMRLGTTVKPIDGPHDLDFVCELAISHCHADPIDLLNKLYNFFKQSGVYGSMVEKKKRCIRIIYKDDFYLDLLPACRDHQTGGTCVQVPDRAIQDWTPSNPIAFGNWFEKATRNVLVAQFSESYRGAMDKAISVEPIPGLEATGDKTVLQLIVQLLKRWRDIHYANSSFPPISIVLTTLAAECYTGEAELSEALRVVLDRIVARLDLAYTRGEKLQVKNPIHQEENFSERWDSNPRAYQEFETGIRRLSAAWNAICVRQGNVDKSLEDLFGNVINNVIVNRANRTQVSRATGKLGITSTGMITAVGNSIASMRRNTNDGK